MCIFCDIVADSIPAYKLYEDDNVLAFLDISQVTKGHTLIIPKTHCDHFLECDEAQLHAMMKVAQQLGKHIMERTGANGMHILSNIHEAAGQTVSHFHIHLIPRYDENDACIIQFQPSEEQDLAQLQKQLALPL